MWWAKLALLLTILGIGMFSVAPFFRSGHRGNEFPNTVQSIEVNSNECIKLNSHYCIKYGDKNARDKIIEFFSFQCPHCVKLYMNDFSRIKTDLVDTGKIYFEFHPVPQDLTTVQALICLKELDEAQKRLFFEVLLEEAVPSDPELMAKLMVAAMNVLNKPIPQLDDHDFLKNHPIFDEIYPFIKQEKILAVPTVEYNGHLYQDEVPTYAFIKSFIKG